MITLVSMFAGVQLLGVVGLFGFPILLSLLRYLNETGTVISTGVWRRKTRRQKRGIPGEKKKEIFYKCKITP